MVIIISFSQSKPIVLHKNTLESVCFASSEIGKVQLLLMVQWLHLHQQAYKSEWFVSRKLKINSSYIFFYLLFFSAKTGNCCYRTTLALYALSHLEIVRDVSTYSRGRCLQRSSVLSHMKSWNWLILDAYCSVLSVGALTDVTVVFQMRQSIMECCYLLCSDYVSLHFVFEQETWEFRYVRRWLFSSNYAFMCF